MFRSRQYDSTSSSSATGLGSSSKGLASGLLDIGISTGFPPSRRPARGRTKVAPCLWLINLGAIASTSAWAAPPTQPADARGSIALYCADECSELKLDGLALRARLPQTATAPTVVITDVTDSWTRPDSQTLAQWGEGNVDGMSTAGQIVLIAWATPRNQAALTLARVLQVAVEAGPWVEDVDTGRLLARVPAQEMSSEAMRDAPDVARLATIDIYDMDDGTTTLSTRGLVRLGLPDIVERGVASSDSQT
ncbi:MAG: hypothetical protein GXP62_20140 [Oligoflexia bacterium]|nr:hypothetical protein [Oligoflexia bacterium]